MIRRLPFILALLACASLAHGQASERNPNNVTFTNNVTINGTFTLATKTANTVFAGPTSGGAAAPAFRALVAADIPSLDAAAIGSGTLPVSRGGTGLTSFGGTNQVMYTSSANTIATIATANSSVLATNGSGAPSWVTTLPAVSGVNLTALNGSNIGSGTVPVSVGGTGFTSYTAGDLLYASGATAFSKLAAGTSSQVLIGGSAPAWSSNVPFLNAANTFTVQNTFAAGTITTSQPFTITQTWNASGVTFNGLLVNATNTASAAASTLADFQVGGTSMVNITRAGAIVAPSTLTLTGGNYTMSLISGTGITFVNNNNISVFNGSMGFADGVFIAFSSTNNPAAVDTKIARSGNDAIYLRSDRTTAVAPTLELQGKSSTTSGRKVGTIAAAWATSTDASRKGRVVFNASDATADREAIRIESDGSNGFVGIAGAVDSTAKLNVNGTAKATAFSGDGSALTGMHNPLSVYAAGTAYTLTGTYAALDFGTTDPAITVNVAGTYLVIARVVVKTNGVADPYTNNFKLRRTNNTAGDVSNSTTTQSSNMPADLGTETMTHTVCLPPVLYTTANTNDALTIFGQCAEAVGNVTVVEASIVAVRVQ